MKSKDLIDDEGCPCCGREGLDSGWAGSDYYLGKVLAAAHGFLYCGNDDDCPFCGSKNLNIGRGIPDRKGTPMYVYCNDCGAQGPWAYLNEEDPDLLSSLNHVGKKTGWYKRTFAVPKISADRDRKPFDG